MSEREGDIISEAKDVDPSPPLAAEPLDPLEALAPEDFVEEVGKLMNGEKAELLKPWTRELTPEELSLFDPNTRVGFFYKDLEKALTIFKERGMACLLVGGALRNILQGKREALTDLDLTLLNLDPDKPITNINDVLTQLFGEVIPPDWEVNPDNGRKVNIFYARIKIPDSQLRFMLLRSSDSEKKDIPTSLKLVSDFDTSLRGKGPDYQSQGTIADFGWAGESAGYDPIAWAAGQPREDSTMAALIPEPKAPHGIRAVLIDFYDGAGAIQNPDMPVLHFAYRNSIFPKESDGTPTAREAFWATERILRFANLAGSLGRDGPGGQFLRELADIQGRYDTVKLEPKDYERADDFLEHFRNLLDKGLKRDTKNSYATGTFTPDTIRYLTSPQISQHFPRLNAILGTMVEDPRNRSHEVLGQMPATYIPLRVLFQERVAELGQEFFQQSNKDMFTFFTEILRGSVYSHLLSILGERKPWPAQYPEHSLQLHQSLKVLFTNHRSRRGGRIEDALRDSIRSEVELKSQSNRSEAQSKKNYKGNNKPTIREYFGIDANDKYWDNRHVEGYIYFSIEQYLRNIFNPVADIGFYRGGRDLIRTPITSIVNLGLEEAEAYIADEKWVDDRARPRPDLTEEDKEQIRIFEEQQRHDRWEEIKRKRAEKKIEKSYKLQLREKKKNKK